MSGAPFPHGTLVFVVCDPTAPAALEVTDETTADEVAASMRAYAEHGTVAMARANRALIDAGFEPVTGQQMIDAVIYVARAQLAEQGQAN